MFNMEIRVFVYANREAKSDNKRLFERLIVWSEDIVFPQEYFFKVFQICFGKRCIIDFEYSAL